MATLRQLRTFITVAEYKKMSEAAKHLYISQPTVSQIISELEHEYKTCLFTRTPRELHITQAGQVLLNYAKEIIMIHEHLDHSMQNIQSHRQLNIGGTLTVGNTIMGEIVSGFMRNYPDIDVNVIIDNTKHIEELFLRGDLDMALVEGIIRREEILTEPAINDNLCLICGSEHPFADRNSISIYELKNERFIMREKGSGTRAILENVMRTYRVPYVVKWECTSSTAIIDAVHNNLGLAVLSERCVAKYMGTKNVYIIPIKEIAFDRYFYLCRNKKHIITSQMNDFVKYMNTLRTCDGSETPLLY